MKELVYHRALLPAADQFADKVISVDGPFRATFKKLKESGNVSG